jgi:alkyl-hydroperoxide reductase/thiol specific antioxidant family protein
VQGQIEARGAGIVVVGNGPANAIDDFRRETSFTARVLTDPSLATYRAAGLVSGVTTVLDPRSLVRLPRAMRTAGRGAISGSVMQQGGTFVLGPGEVEHFAWRDRFGGDHAPMERVLAALPR